MADVGIKILSPTGAGVQGGPEQVIFTTKYPFAKLDTQLGVNDKTNPPLGPVSFQNISIFFNTDPPYNAGGGNITTLVYKFAHGYNYIPTWWVLFQNTNASNNTSQWTYGNEGAIILSKTPSTYAQLLVHVDATYMYFYVLKAFNVLDTQANIIGFTIKLRTYIFTDPVAVS